MITLNKIPGKDFIILSLTDPQLWNEEWNEGRRERRILEYTLDEIIKRTKPDLITITGDIAWAGETDSYRNFAELIDPYGIPWAPVWGNHDNQDGPEYINKIVDIYSGYKNFTYEKNDEKMGNGNYVIAIKESERVVEGVFMIDSHDREDEIKHPDGSETIIYSKLYPEQIEWYKAENEKLKALGCSDTSMFMHIPIYAYRDAWDAAYKAGIVEKPSRVPLAESYTDKFWNEGYTDSFGLKCEGICSHPKDDGVLDAILEGGTTRHVVAGHDHVNNFVINYKGVRLIYGTKIGEGCYWREELNGGTVLTVGSDGIRDVHHEYIDVSHITSKE